MRKDNLSAQMVDESAADLAAADLAADLAAAAQDELDLVLL